MALFLYSLTDKGKVNFCEIAHKLGVDIKKLEQEAEQLDRGMERESAEGLAPDIPVEEDVDKIMSEAPHWRGRPG